MNPAYWDHVGQFALAGVVAVNTEIAICPLPQNQGLYAVRFFCGMGSSNGAAAKQVEAAVEAVSASAGSTIFRKQYLSYVEGATGEHHCLPAMDLEIVTGPVQGNSRALLTLRTAMVAGDLLTCSIFARYLGGIRAAGPLRVTAFPQ